MTADRSLRRRRGKFYTPRTVVDLCWRVLRAWIPPDELDSYRVVDPAAGDGVFLREACRQGWINPANAVGVELYPDENAARLPFRFERWNGLLDLPEAGFIPGAFDLVIGNPPFGGEGFRRFVYDRLEAGDFKTLETLLRRYNSWSGAAERVFPPAVETESWFRTAGGLRAAQKLALCPIELLFVERFLQLCKEGRWCVVVLPEGVLANARLRQARENIAAQATVLGVVSLPRGAFRREGTSARTALVFLRKKAGIDSPVYLASPSYSRSGLEDQFYLEQAGLELAFQTPPRAGVWVPRTEWNTERWDPGFWNPLFRANAAAVRRCAPLGDYVEFMTYGPILPGKRPQNVEGGVRIIGQRQFTEAGLDLSGAVAVAAGSVFDPIRSRVRREDFLLPRSGEGALLKFKAGVYQWDEPANITCFVDLIRLRGIDPYYVWLVFKTRFLRLQILRLQNGVGAPNLNFQEIRNLRIPRLDREEQQAWRERYLQLVAPLQARRVAAENREEKAEWGRKADEAFRLLVQSLEERLAERICR